jgi:hypothetical protein
MDRELWRILIAATLDDPRSTQSSLRELGSDAKGFPD